MSVPEAHRFADDGRFPNSSLPLLVYRAALPPDAEAMIRAFADHGWSNSWRDGIFPYHHFHSIAHEVLGIASGWVEVAFGGPSGRAYHLEGCDELKVGKKALPLHKAKARGYIPCETCGAP